MVIRSKILPSYPLDSYTLTLPFCFYTLPTIQPLLYTPFFSSCITPSTPTIFLFPPSNTHSQTITSSSLLKSYILPSYLSPTTHTLSYSPLPYYPLYYPLPYSLSLSLSFHPLFYNSYLINYPTNLT